MSALLSALGKLAREDQDAWATLSPEAIPVLSVDDKDRIVRQVLALQLAERAQAGDPRSAPAQETTPSDQLTLRRQRRHGRPGGWALALGGTAAAAAALLLVMNGSPTRGDRSPVPDYSVSATGGRKTVRGASGHAVEEESTVAEKQVLGPETALTVVCRPQTSVSGAIAARAFFVHDGASRELRPEARTAPSGAIELTARARDILAAGPGLTPAGQGGDRLRIVVGRPELVAAVRAEQAQEGTPGSGVHWLTVPVELAPGFAPVNSR